MAEKDGFFAAKADRIQPVNPSVHSAQKNLKKTAHHAGHRQRLRDKFMQHGHEPLADYELLELMLFRSIPRLDVKGLAKELLEKFGNLSAVFGAQAEQLMEVRGVSERVAADLKLFQGLMERSARSQLLNKPVISSWQILVDYCKTSLAQAKREQFRLLFLDRKNRLVADEIFAHGTIDRAPVYPREIIRRALELSATAVILVHNHPSGDPTPSRDDIDITRKIIEAGKPLGVAVHDHLIVAQQGVVSFKQLGLIKG